MVVLVAPIAPLKAISRGLANWIILYHLLHLLQQHSVLITNLCAYMRLNLNLKPWEKKSRKRTMKRPIQFLKRRSWKGWTSPLDPQSMEISMPNLKNEYFRSVSKTRIKKQDRPRQYLERTTGWGLLALVALKSVRVRLASKYRETTQSLHNWFI